MKTFIIALQFLFLSTFVSAQLSPKEKALGVTLEARDNAINELYYSNYLFNTKQYDECLKVLLGVAKADPAIINTYTNLYKTAMILGNFSDEVLNCFIKGAKIYRDDDEINFFLAELLNYRSKYKEATVSYSNAIVYGRTKKNKSAYFQNYFSSRGFCRLQTGLYKEAIVDYTEFLGFQPQNAAGFLNRGFCYSQLGEDCKAVSDWEKAVSLGSSKAKEFLKQHKKT